MRDAWVRSLREGFTSYYKSEVESGDIAVFGGRPGADQDRKVGVPSGIKSWGLWEFMYDVSVVRVSATNAAYAKVKGKPSTPARVPFAHQAVWLVESEVAKNGTEVAIDASKLRMGQARYKLLIAAHASRPDPEPWRNFLGDTLRGIQGEAFVGLLPSYSSVMASSKKWWMKKAEIALYREVNGCLEPLCVISAEGSKPLFQS